MEDKYFCNKRNIKIFSDRINIFCENCIKKGFSGYVDMNTCQNYNLTFVDNLTFLDEKIKF